MWLLIIAFIGLAAANERLLSEGYSRRLTKLAATEYTLRTGSEEEHSVIYFPTQEQISMAVIDKISEKIAKKEKLFSLNTTTITCDWGEGPDYFRFVPQFKVAAFPGKGPVTFSNHCYKKVTAEVLDISSTSVTLGLSSLSPSSVCYDTYFVSLINKYHIFVVDFLGTKKITFENLTSSELIDISLNGVRVFTFCDGIEELISDLTMTVALFAGGFGQDPIIPFFGSHTTEKQEEHNVKFISEAMGYNMTRRSVNKVNIDPNDIHSGDFLAVMRLDGLDEIIMFGTGGRVGHSTMALWVTEEDGTRELYIVESQAGWYWPRTGLQMNKFAKWIEWADNASFNVAVLPLRPEVRELFDEEAVYKWFLTVEGMPYGYHNFVFGWIDTETQNLPPILEPEFLTVGLAIAETIIPGAITSIYGEAMNLRLGTLNLTIPQLQEEAAKKNQTLLQVMTIPEMDGWWYSDGLSYVCSSFVLAMYKQAGILGSLKLQGTEFTPKDVYSLNIFDPAPVLPEVCLQTGDNLPYCQILGDWRIDLGKDYSSITPYSYMNQNCPSVAPEYYRTPGC